MNKISIVSLICTLCISTLSAKTRRFTNHEGKSITAELVSMEQDKAILRLKSSRIVKIPVDTLSESDQKFVKSWWEENKNKIGSMDLKMTIEKKTTRLSKTESGGGNKGKSKKGRGGVQTTKTKDETQYLCQLKSYAKRPLPDITAEYTIYKRVSTRGNNGSSTMTRETDGNASIPSILAHGKADFTTIRVTTEDVTQKGGKGGKGGKAKGGGDSSKKETILGIVVTLKVDGKEFLKQSYPETFLDRLEEQQEIEERKFRDDE